MGWWEQVVGRYRSQGRHHHPLSRLAAPPRYAATAVTAVAVTTVALVTTVGPASGTASGVVRRLGAAVSRLGTAAPNGRAFTGVPAVGALFPSGSGTVGQHSCTASVVHSPAGDLAVTAAHCVSGVTLPMTFIPGFYDNAAPYGTWQVTRVYTDQAWQASANPDDDVAFLRLSPAADDVPIEDVTGAEQLGIGWPAQSLVHVIGYPEATDEPVKCENWTRQFSATQLEFDCGGYTNGTSGGPLLANVNPASGQGTVIGVIGGYEQGGDTPSVSYAAVFGPDVANLYQTAITTG